MSWLWNTMGDTSNRHRSAEWLWIFHWYLQNWCLSWCRLCRNVWAREACGSFMFKKSHWICYYIRWCSYSLEITAADENSSFYNGGQNHSIIGMLQRPISTNRHGRVSNSSREFTNRRDYHEALVHEDNSGALVLAKTFPSQFTPWSKYYAIKMIWFCEEIHKLCVQLLKIDTVKQ